MDQESRLYREYRDVLPMFSYMVETERRFYLANEVEVHRHTETSEPLIEIILGDAWVWDMHRPARFVKGVRVLTLQDVNVEELTHDDEPLPPPE